MRSLPANQLNVGEHIVVELRPHWLFLGGPLVGAVVVAAADLGLTIAYPDAPAFVDWMLVAVLAIAWVWFGFRVLRWKTTRLTLTSNRIVQRSGVITRSGLEIRLARINELRYVQHLVDRVFGCGQLLVETGGEAGVIVFDFIRHPASVQALITEQLDALGHHSSTHSEGNSQTYADTGQSQLPRSPQQVSEDRTPPAGTPAVAGMTVYAQPSASSPTPNRYRSSAPDVRSPAAPSAPDQASRTEAVAPGPSSTPRAPQSVADRLIQLDDLFKRGIISHPEYAAKKAQLLDEL